MRVSTVVMNVVQGLVIGLPLYFGMSWRTAVLVHGILFAIWFVQHMFAGRAHWDNVDFGVQLFFTACLVALLWSSVSRYHRSAADAGGSLSSIKACAIVASGTPLLPIPAERRSTVD